MKSGIPPVLYLQNICILTSVEDIWLRTAESFKFAMEEAGIENVMHQYLFQTGLSDGTRNQADRIVDIFDNLRDLARSGLFL